jgi:hypothetical protein
VGTGSRPFSRAPAQYVKAHHTDMRGRAPKRYMLLLSLISRAPVQARDDLAEMFGKRMALFETRAKEALALIGERERETTEMLVGAFENVIYGGQDSQTVMDVAAGRVPDLLKANKLTGPS